MRTVYGTRRTLLRCAIITFLLAGVWGGAERPSGSAYGNPAARTVSETPEGRVFVDTGLPSIPADGSFIVRTTVRVDEPTPYLEIRMQLSHPSGALIFQRTDISSDVETGTVSAEFTRALGDLSLVPGSYPYEIRVRTEVGTPREQIVTGHLLIHDREPLVTPVALIVRITDVPGFDPAGNFVVDPALTTSGIDQVSLLARALIEDSDLHLTLGLPGMTLDAWARSAAGYTLSGPDGLRQVAATETTPRRYAEALDLLREALATGRLELLNIPYADPDIGMLSQAGSLLNLGVHYAHSRSSYQAVLDESPSAGTAIFGDTLSPGALAVLEERDISWVLLGPEPLTAGETTPTGGTWKLDGTGISALVTNSVLAEALASEDATSTLAHLFTHSISEEATVPVAAAIELGAGDPQGAARILAFASLVSDVPWADLTTASDAAATPVLGVAVPPATVEPRTAAPASYLQEMAEARRYATAFEAAAGIADTDVQAATEASLIAESARWAGPDESWNMADRGRAFGSASVRLAASFLDQVSLTVRDVTLSGPSGELPLGIRNESPKDLTLRLVLVAEDLRLPQGNTQSLTVRPQENLHNISVDLRSSLSERVTVELWAGEVLLDSTSATVTASYLDRLALVGGAALLLVGLLVVIRRRMRSPDAGKMP